KATWWRFSACTTRASPWVAPSEMPRRRFVRTPWSRKARACSTPSVRRRPSWIPPNNTYARASDMRIGTLPRPTLIAALAAAFVLGAPNVAAQGNSVPASWLQLIGLLPAPTYDPYESQIPRRRPGHPPEPLPMFVEQNPDALNPAPVDQAGSFVPVPDRWRIMESLGV